MADSNATTVTYPGVLPPPPGERVDMDHPESMAHELILTAVLCPLITAIFILVRMYTARFIVRKMYTDDCRSSALTRGNAPLT
jgi:hypothetical protein